MMQFHHQFHRATVLLLSGRDPGFSNWGSWKLWNRSTGVAATYCWKSW